METKKVYKKDKVLNMFKENEDLMATDIADKLGVSRQYVARILKQAGQDTRKRQKELTEDHYLELEKKYRELYSIDTSLKEMTEKLGVSSTVVNKVSIRTGLRLRSLADIRKCLLYKEILLARKEGKTFQVIADEQEVTRGYIQRIFRWGKDRNCVEDIGEYEVHVEEVDDGSTEEDGDTLNIKVTDKLSEEN